MSRKLFRRIVYVLVAGQLLLSAPIVSAMANATAPGSSAMDCAEMMSHAPESDACPCCPDGAMGTAACLSACTASVGAISTYLFCATRPEAVSRPVPVAVPVARASDPPLKPPPIV